jgi:hypothetical protein
MENRHTKRFSLGYGIGYTCGSWKQEVYSPTARPPIEKSRNGLGIMAAGHFRANRVCSFGLLYRSSLYDMDRGSFGPYEHVISLDISFPVKVFNVRRAFARKGR